MSDGKRSPSSRYPQWCRRRIFTNDRESPSRARRATRQDASSSPPIQPSPDEPTLAQDPGTSAGAGSRRSRQATPHQRYAPLLGDAQSQQFLCKRYEQGDEDLGCFNAVSPTTDAFRESPVPPSARDLAGLGDDLGDSSCFVTMVSQQRRPKSSMDLVLRARGDEDPERQTGGVTQVGADNFRSEARAIPTSPSISVSVHREIQRVKRQPAAGTQQAAPVLAAQRRTLSPHGGPNADTPFNVESTSARKPGTDARDPAASRGKRQGLTIDISFARSVAVDKEGKLLKSISANVERIVANILQRHSEDQQPLSRYATEGTVIELDNQPRVSVDVTLNEARQRKPPSTTLSAMPPDTGSRGKPPVQQDAVKRPADEGAATGARSYDLQPMSTPSSIIHLTVGPINMQGAPRGEDIRKHKRDRPPFAKTEVTAEPVPQPLAIGPPPESSARKKSLPGQPPADRRAKPGKKAGDTTVVDKDSSIKEDTSDIAKKRLPSTKGEPEESKLTVQKPAPPPKSSARKKSLPAQPPADLRSKPGKTADDTTAVDKDSSIKEDSSDIAKKRLFSTKGEPEESKLTVQKPVPEMKADKDGELEKSVLKTEKRKSIQQESKKQKRDKGARKASRPSSSETGQPVSGRKQSLMAKKQLAAPPPLKESSKETDISAEEARLKARIPSAPTGKGHAPANVMDQEAKVHVEAKIATQEPAAKGAESIQEHQKIATEAAAVKVEDTSDAAKKGPPSTKEEPEGIKLPAEKPVPEEKADKDGEPEKSVLKTEKRKSIQREGKRPRHEKKARKASKASSSETGEPVSGRKQSLKAKKQPPAPAEEDKPKETGGPPEEPQPKPGAPPPPTGKDDAAMALAAKTDEATKASVETKMSSREPATKEAENVQEHREIASEAVIVKGARKESMGPQKTKDHESSAHPELKDQEPEKASKEPGESSHKLIESPDQKDRKDRMGPEEALRSKQGPKDEDTKTLSIHSILKKPKKKKSKKRDKGAKVATAGVDEPEEKGHAEEMETGERISKRGKNKKSSMKSRKKPGGKSVDSDVGTRHAKADRETGKDLDRFLEGFERALDPYLVLVGLEPSPAPEEDRKIGKPTRRKSVVRMSQIDVERKRGKEGQSGETSPVGLGDDGAGGLYGGVPISSKDIEALDLEAEEEARRMRKERKREKRKKKKRSKQKYDRDQPIDYRSGGGGPCRIVCPVIICLLFVGILGFIIFKLLGASTITTTPAVTLTRATPKTRPPRPPATVSPPPPGPPPPGPPTGPPTGPPHPTSPSSVTPKPTVPTPPTKPPPPLGVYVCQSERCKREGAYIATLLSRDSKPCDNFYDYVCDAWSRDNPAGPHGLGSVVSRDTMIQDSMALQLLAVIKSAPDADLKIAAALHTSCAARPAPDSNVGFAREMFGKWAIKSWPLDQNKDADVKSLWKFAGELIRDLGVSALFTLTVGVSPKGAPDAVVELGCPHFLFDKSEESITKVDEMFRGAVEELLTMFPGNSSGRHAKEIKNTFVELGRLSEASECRGAASSHEGWTLVQFASLDDGVKMAVSEVFKGIVPSEKIGPHTLLKSATYIRKDLVSFISKHPPHQVLNYMGFLVFVRLAPFFADRLTYLRSLFSRTMLGRTVLDVANSTSLCVLAVESLLPNCFSKASAILRNKTDSAFGARAVLSRLETIFGAQIKHLSWVGELSALFIRYGMQGRPIVQFGPRAGSCASEEGVDKSVPLKHYYQISLLQQQRKLQALLNSTAAGNARAFESDLDTSAQYDPTRRAIHVPAAIINASVNTNESLFAFHLSRVATRLYRAMTKLLMDYTYGSALVPDLTESSIQRLDSLLDCIGKESSAAKLKSQRRAALEQAVAIHLAFQAFHELLHVRRIWNLDFRLPGLSNTSADQLFFVYLALDNCDSTDNVYRQKQPVEASSEFRINIPLRHLEEFSKAFQCNTPHNCKIVGQMKR